MAHGEPEGLMEERTVLSAQIVLEQLVFYVLTPRSP